MSPPCSIPAAGARCRRSRRSQMQRLFACVLMMPVQMKYQWRVHKVREQA